MIVIETKKNINQENRQIFRIRVAMKKNLGELEYGNDIRWKNLWHENVQVGRLVQ